jgi:ATP-dependent Lhr-like helicase
MLSEGVAARMRRGAYLHRDRLFRQLRARRGARLAALTSGGAIPETADYRVLTAAERTYVGSVNEDFAIESMAGDVFLLGNTSWRIQHVRAGEVIVTDAQGSPATIPFWLGEAPARTAELSAEVSALREEMAARLSAGGAASADSSGPGEAETCRWLKQACAASEWAAVQACQYIAAEHAAIGLVPTQRRVVFERFFDESGGMQLVIHAPFGARVNRAWGLALRKRFCRSFDFELQASADDNGIVLSLGPQHSFPIEDMFRMLAAHNALALLTQALLAVPMFQTRWRWNATRSLAVLRQHGGKKVPPPLQRFRADDLLTAVFPAQTACLENRPGDILIPDHPLVRQTIDDCLHEAMDQDRWLDLLRAIERGDVELIARDTREPSPFSHQLLNANPYAFLDGAPLEERRARAVATRRSISIDSVRDLGHLDPDAIARVRAEAWPVVRDADELHEALQLLVALPQSDGAPWREEFNQLVAAGRAVELHREGSPALWAITECLPLVRAAFPTAVATPALSDAATVADRPTAADAWVAMVRARLDCVGPTTAGTIARDFDVPREPIQAALAMLEGEGFVLRGTFTPGPATPANGSSVEIEWCERRLLARIHRLTLDGLRRQIQPVEVHDYLRFLLEYQHLDCSTRLHGPDGVLAVVEQLQGFELPAGVWEHEILSSRVSDYDPAWLDQLSLCGQVCWGRLQPPRKDPEDAPTGQVLSRVVPIALALREHLAWLLPSDRHERQPPARSGARTVLDALGSHGAVFFHDLLHITQLLPAQLDESLSELSALGLVTADGFAAIRSIASPERSRIAAVRRRLARRNSRPARGQHRPGRWSLFPGSLALCPAEQRVEPWAEQLLRRYGVVFRDLLARETSAPSWGQLLPVYRRLEARGEIRGGRFVAGVAGEQFATTEVVEWLRRTRDAQAAPDADGLVVSAADPFNLFAWLGAGPRIAATAANRLFIRGGRLVASLQSGTVEFHQATTSEDARLITRRLRLAGPARRHEELLSSRESS